MKPGPLCILACQWCKLPAFQQWAGVADADAARLFILQKCRLDGRKHLDTNLMAGRRFNHHIRQPFMQSQGVSA